MAAVAKRQAPISATERAELRELIVEAISTSYTEGMKFTREDGVYHPARDASHAATQALWAKFYDLLGTDD